MSYRCNSTVPVRGPRSDTSTNSDPESESDLDEDTESESEDTAGDEEVQPQTPAKIPGS